MVMNDNNDEFGVLFTDLPKAFDSIDHSLLLEKLCEYGLPHISLKLIVSYFESRTQRTKINNCFNCFSVVSRQKLIMSFLKVQYWVLYFLT